jgi:hypothetical protein
MAISPTDLSSTVFFVAVIALVYVRRILLSISGTPVSGTRLALYSVFVGVLFALAIVTGYSIVPWYLYPALGAAVVAAFFVAEPYVRSRVVVEERGAGRWVYRLSPIVPLVYVLLFVVRLLLDLFVLNLDPLVSSFGPVTVSAGAAAVLVVIDVLFALSTGLVLGRNVGVYRAYAARLRGPPASAPLP